VAEFKRKGANAIDQQLAWMIEQETKWAMPIRRKIEWRADKTQTGAIQMWRNRLGFRIQQSDGKQDSRDTNIRNVARRLLPDKNGIPGSFYLPELVQWEREMKEYTRDSETGKIVRINDDLMDADLYMEEGIGMPIGDPAKHYKNAIASIS
jgi:hypothetical protein